MTKIHELLLPPTELVAFVRTVEMGSIAAASRHLDLTPSAVSKLVSRLEARLDAELLTRTTRRLTLTDEGATFLRYARDILIAMEDAKAAILETGSLPGGTLRINAGIAFGRHQLVPILPRFLAKYPSVFVDLQITDRRVEIQAETADVILRTGDLDDTSAVARKICVARRVICASVEYLQKHGEPKSSHDLLAHNCLHTSQFADLMQWPFKGAKPEPVSAKGDIMAGNADVLLDLALAGHGIVRLLEPMVDQHIRSGKLKALLTESHFSEPVPIWAITPSARNRIPRVRAFLDFLIEEFRSPSWMA